MTPQPDKMTHEEVLRVKLEVLRREHRDLDVAIDALGGQATAASTATLMWLLMRWVVRPPLTS